MSDSDKPSFSSKSVALTLVTMLGAVACHESPSVSDPTGDAGSGGESDSGGGDGGSTVGTGGMAGERSGSGGNAAGIGARQARPVKFSPARGARRTAGRGQGTFAGGVSAVVRPVGAKTGR